VTGTASHITSKDLAQAHLQTAASHRESDSHGQSRADPPSGWVEGELSALADSLGLTRQPTDRAANGCQRSNPPSGLPSCGIDAVRSAMRTRW
jgi:hypothetical protein